MASGEDPAARAVALHEQAIAARLGGRYQEGERACREAAAIFEAVDGPGSADLANALIAHGRLLDRLDRLSAAEAEALARRALARAEAAYPGGDHLVAEALNALGMIHKFQGRYAEAEPLYQRALALVPALGDVEAEATVLHNLGGLCHARGDFAAGEPPARRAVELREAHLGPEHPATAADREAWGALLEGLGRLEEAERAYTSSLATIEARLGRD